MNEENQVYFIDSDQLPPAALERKHKLEQDPSFRTDYMKYLDDMEIIDSDIKDKVLKAMDEYDYDSYTAKTQFCMWVFSVKIIYMQCCCQCVFSEIIKS